MHFLFISSLLTLSHSGPYPLSPAGYWPSATDYVPKGNETWNPAGCSKSDAIKHIPKVSSWFRHGTVMSALPDTKNFFISPLSVLLALSSLTAAPIEPETPSNNANGISPEQCFKFMGMQALIDYLADYKSAGLSLASGAFVSPKVELSSEFVQSLTKTFRTPLRLVDFENPMELSNFVSRWGRPDSSSIVNTNTSLALVNVIYLKAEWETKFDPARTDVVKGWGANNTRVIENRMFIYKNIRTGNLGNYGGKFYELPFKPGKGGRKMSLFIMRTLAELLPLSWGSVTDIEKFSLTDMLAQNTFESCSLFVNKFKVESVITIGPAANEALAKAGIFHPETSKLMRISQSPNLFGDKFVQKISLEIDENGCEAVISDTLPDPEPEKPTIWYPSPDYIMIATTDENPQVIFLGRRFH